ncbi:MAG: hypothetical protein K0R48_161 [Gammaproteobacteria bacterium]|jgi:hypothetical protein|nr:hypothetical protein [Gammaproteobacteria bacterium]
MASQAIIKIIEDHISAGKELYSKYEKYDKSVRFEVIFIEVEDFSDPVKEICPTIYYSVNKAKKHIEARVYDALRSRFSDQKFYAVYVPISELPTDKPSQETLTEIIRELSLNSAYFHIFNLQGYKRWKDDCMQMLEHINYGGNDRWFPQDRYDLHPNRDRAFLDLFSRQIGALETRLKLISEPKNEVQYALAEKPYTSSSQPPVYNVQATNSNVNINTEQSSITTSGEK